MDQAPDQLRNEIARTRADMSDTINAIGDHVSPSRIVERRRNQLASTLTSVRDRVMGTVGGAGASGRDTAGSAIDRAKHAPEAISETAQGSPLGAGLVALGLGFVAAAVFPASSRERELTGQLMDEARPVVDDVRSDVQNAVHRLEQPTQEAVEEVRTAASDAVDDVKAHALDAAAETRDVASRPSAPAPAGSNRPA